MVVEGQQIDELKQQLLARQQKLVDLIRPTAVKVHGKTIKSADQQAQIEWSQIKKALARIDAGTYGQCVVCGEAIDNPRLTAYPHTPFCRSCVSP
ncbi:MAG: TraR/DksA family transcriptional regulator [Proteobacteria bacterium]|nr:MAG: TraR/DksA family transcriptional regulator [Pseudomonadota bacterium]